VSEVFHDRKQKPMAYDVRRATSSGPSPVTTTPDLAGLKEPVTTSLADILTTYGQQHL
jgi:hypothetical protein